MPDYCLANYNALRRQLKALDRFQGDPASWHGLLERLVTEEINAHADAGAVEDDRTRVVLLDNGCCEPPVPVVAGEIILEAPELGSLADAQRILERFGFETVADGPLELDGAADEGGENPPPVVRRFRANRRDVDLAAVIAAINGNPAIAARAATNTLRVMNVVTKSKSGAEPACCVPESSPADVDNTDFGSPLVVVLDTGKFLDGHRDELLQEVTGEADPRVDPGGYLNLSAGHGTFIAGVIRQMSPRTRIEVRQVIGAAGFVTDTDLADAIIDAGNYINAEGEHGVINLSLGSEDLGDQRPPEIAEALRNLPARVAVVAAAGNRNSGKKTYPAAFAEDHHNVASVASLDRYSLPSSWSNRGSWVTFSAVGEGIVSTYLEGKERPGTSLDEDPYDPEPDVWVGPKPWAVWTGTSFAVPQIAVALSEKLADGAIADDAITGLRADFGGDDRAIPDFGVPMPRGEAPMVVDEPTRPDGDPNPRP